MKYIEKTTHLLFALSLLACAALQFNDPDPMNWILFYIICAAVPALALVNRPMDSVFWIALIICGIALAIYASGAYNYYLHRNEEPLMQSMNPEKPYIEEAREFLGALIATVFVVISHVLVRYRKK
ncbi:MAG: transmembrane 220 family protein [Pseudomonadota bacterium]|nr:transmembrane 220 family protein [Pseudomonadota bacterium]